MLEYYDRLYFKSGIFYVLYYKRLLEPQYESKYELPQSKAWEYKVLGYKSLNLFLSPSFLLPLRITNTGLNLQSAISLTRIISPPSLLF